MVETTTVIAGFEGHVFAKLMVEAKNALVLRVGFQVWCDTLFGGRTRRTRGGESAEILVFYEGKACRRCSSGEVCGGCGRSSGASAVSATAIEGGNDGTQILSAQGIVAVIPVLAAK